MRKPDGKFLWWDIKDGKADVIDVQLTELFNVWRGREGEYPAVGHREFTHIEKGKPPVRCGPTRDECPACRAGGKASQQFRTVLFAFDAPGRKSDYGGAECVTTFSTTLARKLGEQQKMMKGMGFTDEEILAVRFRVIRAPGNPYSTYDVSLPTPPQKGAKPLVPTLSIDLPTFDRPHGSAMMNNDNGVAPPVQVHAGSGAPTGQVPAVPVEPGVNLLAQAEAMAVVPEVPKAPEAPKFTPAELKTVRDLNSVIQARLKEDSPLYDPSFGPKAKPSIEATLRANKMAEAKIAAVMATVGDDCVIHDEALGVA